MPSLDKYELSPVTVENVFGNEIQILKTSLEMINKIMETIQIEYRSKYQDNMKTLCQVKL